MLLYWPPRQDVLNGLNGHEAITEQLLADWIFRATSQEQIPHLILLKSPWRWGHGILCVCFFCELLLCCQIFSKHHVSTHRVRLLSAMFGETSFPSEKQLTERWLISWRGEHECSALNKASALTTLPHSISGNIRMTKWEECRKYSGVLWRVPSRCAVAVTARKHNDCSHKAEGKSWLDG